MGHVYDFRTGFTTDESAYPIDTSERPFRVYLDGRRMKGIVCRAEAGLEGLLEVYVRGADGRFVLDEGRYLVTEELRGEVRVEACATPAEWEVD